MVYHNAKAKQNQTRMHACLCFGHFNYFYGLTLNDIYFIEKNNLEKKHISIGTISDIVTDYVLFINSKSSMP